MLDIIALQFDYQDQPLLDQINFQVNAGGLLHLKGANGAGKTTLLKLIAGLHQPVRGEIRLFGEAITRNQQQICLVGHKPGINPQLTLRENCYYDLQNNLDEASFNALAGVFNLEKYWDKPCALLSAGQRRQAGLLRLWMTKATLWLLDEPLVALDEAAQVILLARIAAHRVQGGMVILTSHQTVPLGDTAYQEYQL